MTDLDTRTARRRKLIGAGLVAVLAAVLIAIVVVRSTGEKLLNENGDTLVLVGKEDATSSTGLATGVLADVGGCLGVVDEDDPTADGMVIIWPHGTTIKTPEPLRVTVGDETYRIGDTVRLGGEGTGPLDESSYFHDKVPAGCRSASVFVAG